MTKNMGLPAGANQWVRTVDGAMQSAKDVEAIARRMATDLGLDYSSPKRGLNEGDAPSVQKTVQLKLPSLKDLEVRDALDGDLLTFDGTRGVWVARRHDTVVLPKEFPVGDPDSYYNPAPADGIVRPDTWNVPIEGTNEINNSDFSSGTFNWAPAVFDGSDPNIVDTITLESAPGEGDGGGSAMRITATGKTTGGFAITHWGAMQEVPVGTTFVSGRMKFDSNADWTVGFIYDTPDGLKAYAPGYDNFGSTGVWVNRSLDMRNQPGYDGVTRQWAFFSGSVSTEGTSTALVDKMLATTGPITEYFDGGMSDTWAKDYSFLTNGNSHLVMRPRIFFPKTFSAGSKIEVQGTNWEPNGLVGIRNLSTWGTWQGNIPVDASGNFTVVLDTTNVEPGEWSLMVDDWGDTFTNVYSRVIVTAAA